MEFPQPLYDNAPLSDSASRQAIMHFALANHLSYAAVDQLLAFFHHQQEYLAVLGADLLMAYRFSSTIVGITSQSWTTEQGVAETGNARRWGVTLATSFLFPLLLV